MRAPLFRRLTRKVELKPFGQNYLSAATAASDCIERETVKSLQEAKALSLSLLLTLGALWLMQRLTSAMAEHREMRLEVSSSLETANFKRDGIDVALRVVKVPGVNCNLLGSQITFRMTESWGDVITTYLWDDSCEARQSPARPSLRN
ncbi:hypothetical protein [Paraburkholderia caribensis]|uniref:hypothetical protein n=1 Tax=Paraburkholderia caribensis TaxID=75105 RepID=UPI00209845C5|nr:hypothetical protein [Paraburkholderia caribensis]